MKNKKWICFLTAILALSMLFSACVPGDQESDGSQTANTSEATDTTVAGDDTTEKPSITVPAADSKLPSINIESKDSVFALREGLPFCFEDIAAHTADGGVCMQDGILFADSYIVAGMFDFNHSENNGEILLESENSKITMKADSNSVSVDGTSYSFTTTYSSNGRVMVDVKMFASMFGYKYSYDSNGNTHYIFNDESKLTEDVKNEFSERFDLYRDVVYNYDDVECDNTGVGNYKAVDPAERLVGIAYTTWFYSGSKWNKGATWSLPLDGKYLSTRREVIYRHGIQLRDAGVDFVFVDWSNNTNYDPATMSHLADFKTIEGATDRLFEVWSEIPNAPKICIFVGPGHSGIESVQNGNHQKKVDQVWKNYVEKYPDLYFNYLGKPFLLCYGATPTAYTGTPSTIWDDSRFTVRWMTGYVGQQSGLINERTLRGTYWSWEERGAQTYTVNDGKVEAVTVSASTRAQGEPGDASYIPAAERLDGATFKKQFQRAMNLGAGIAVITTWNEWSVGEQPSVEVSRDIEPSEAFGTFYYDLMREQIKKFKGQI